MDDEGQAGRHLTIGKSHAICVLCGTHNTKAKPKAVEKLEEQRTKLESMKWSPNKDRRPKLTRAAKRLTNAFGERSASSVGRSGEPP